MSVDYKVRQIYNDIIHEVTKNAENWKDVLSLTGRIYRYEFDNVLMIYAQKPHSTLVADYDTWKKVDRYVRRGSKGIAIYPSRALQPHCRYVFDISDTGGRKRQLTWTLDGEHLENYAAYLVRNGEIGSIEGLDRDLLKKVIGDFTKKRIDGIIKENHAKRGDIKEAVQSMIDNRYGKVSEIDGADLITKSIYYVVATRCGFELTVDEQDFDIVTAIDKEDVIYELGTFVSDVSCEVLKEFSHNISRFERERRMQYEPDTRVQGGRGRDAVPEYQHGEGEPVKTGQVRTDGNGLSQGEPLSEVQIPREVRETDGSSGTGEQRGISDDRHDDGEVSEKPQTKESGRHDGDVQNQTAGNDAGGGDRDTRDRESVPLKPEKVKQFEGELNRELEDLDSFGEKRETVYEQVSLFSFHDSVLTDKERQEIVDGKYTYLDPKTEDSVPHDYIVSVVKRGSGFIDGKKRIYEVMQTELSKSERIKQIKKEYGQGGAGWPLEGYGLHGYDTFHGKGIRFQWRDEEGEKEGYASWNTIEGVIAALILTEDYYTPEPAIIDSEIVEEELDEYAIPDEAEDMGIPDNVRAEMLDEDRMVTLAEYGEEIMRETEETDFSLPDMTLKGQTAPEHPENFHLDIWDTKDGGQKTRYMWNVDAIRELKKIEAEDRATSADEQKIMSRYVGWGGLAQVFDGNNGMWAREYKELKELLTPEEYEAARASVNNAFYTPSTVASAVTRALTQFGFTKGNILEPSMGVGNFFGCMPEELSGSKLYGVELDKITGRIGKLLYPNAKVEVKGFEETDYQDNFFDVVIGNVPFGDYKLFDPKYNKLNFKVHDYFIAKAIDQVRPGGIVAVITTKGTMDKKNPNVRKYLAERAELVGAVRLPVEVFRGNAGTEVTSDILFFQKRERKIATEPDWVHLGVTENGIPVNSYFAEHPEMMLGKMEYEKGRFGDSSNYTVCVNQEPYFNVYESVSNAIGNIHTELKDFEMISDTEEELTTDIPADPDVKNFTFTVVDDEIYYRKDSRMYQWDVGDKTKNRILGLHNIRELTRHLINIQMGGCSEEELLQAQKALNEKYDSYVKEYGVITNRANSLAFREDSDYPLLCSLEVLDEDGNVTKAEMFTKQTIKAKQSVDSVETAVEALNISINEFNGVNIPYMLSIYTPDITSMKSKVAEKTGEEADNINFSEELTKEIQREKLIQELQGIIFCNPESYSKNDHNRGWETADAYLSGNVREKLRIAKAHAKEQPELFGTNVEALEAVQPKDLDATEIDVGVGTTWIEPEDYQAFIYELLQTPRWARADMYGYSQRGIRVSLDRFSMEWFIENKGQDNRSVAATETYGTKRIYREYKQAEKQGIIGTQLVFSDIGTSKSSWKEEMLESDYYKRGNEFDVYNYIKTELVKKGIPAEEVAFVHDAKTDAQRDTLFREMRQGVKKVMIGSTDKCGTGVNVQAHLIAMHHADCPWKPSSIEQREGRGIRQGNENSEVAVYRYVTKGTFDAYSWSVVENKQRFISQIMTSKSVSRSCEDIDEVTFQYAEIKAVATGNPLIKEKMQIDNDVQRLKLLKASYDQKHYQNQDDFTVKYPKLIKAAEEKLECVRADVITRDDMEAKEPEFSITVGNTSYGERVDGGTALIAAISKAKTGVTTEIGRYKGFTLSVEKNFMGTNYLLLSGKTSYSVETSTSPVGLMMRLENAYNGIQDKITFLEQRLEEYHRNMERAKEDYETPFQYEEELKQKLARQYQINAKLDLDRESISAEQSQDEERSEDAGSEQDVSRVAEEKSDYQGHRR
ncbi:hypothetical protein D7V86_19600 [bacterium D16-51]|nr:hypothetical protein D7V96_19820 [bacterium D16-59]RKI56574.1 hypothetical protein D7V86_19600 [bacterium D16-51]